MGDLAEDALREMPPRWGSMEKSAGTDLMQLLPSKSDRGGAPSANDNRRAGQELLQKVASSQRQSQLHFAPCVLAKAPSTGIIALPVVAFSARPCCFSGHQIHTRIASGRELVQSCKPTPTQHHPGCSPHK